MRITSSNMWATAVMLTAFFTVPSAALAANETDPNTCTDNSRACLLSVAMAYIDGLSTGNLEEVRLAPNVRRTVERASFPTGIFETKGADEIRKAHAGNYCWPHRIIQTIVDEKKDQVVILWVVYNGANQQPSSAQAMERFKIVKGQITEIQVLAVERAVTLEENSALWPEHADVAHLQSSCP